MTNRHIHQKPAPSFNPEVGLTGLETFLEVGVPEPITDSLVSPIGTVVTVEVKVAKATVDWGYGDCESLSTQRDGGTEVCARRSVTPVTKSVTCDCPWL